MIEFTVPLTLPLRAVVRTGADDGPPQWIEEQFARLPVIMAGRRTTIAKTAAAKELQQELEQLRLQRAAWTRGLMEFQNAMDRIEQQRAADLSDLREVAVELAHAIASKLVFQQLGAGNFPMDRLVTEVLSRLNTHEPSTVRLHPEDLAVLQLDGDFIQKLEPAGAVRLVADPKLSRGDCKAVSGEITVIYELRRQIEEIRRELLSTVNGHAEPGP